MTFTNLIALSSLMKKDTVAEAAEKRDPVADFDGIKSVITDCLGDLDDKLGKDGALMTLMKNAGLDKLDTTKDEDGKTISRRMVDCVAKFKKEISGLMDEVEVMVASGAGKEEVAESLTEGKEYSDSSEFTDELHKVGGKILELKSIIRSPRWVNWMQVTDHNFGTNCMELNNTVHTELNELDKAYDTLEDELLKAS